MLARMTTPLSLRDASYAARISFVVELAERLHAYGTTAQRLEGAVSAVAQRFGLDCEPWSNPTGMILTFSDPRRATGEGDTTRVIRLPPGDTDLGRLSEADRIAEDVMAGRMGLSEGHAALLALDRAAGIRGGLVQVAGYGLAAASVGGLLRLPWLDIGVAGATGLAIGALVQASDARPQLKEALDAVAAMLAAAVALLVAAYVAPLNQNTVIIASLIVLLPGMSLTNAVNELTSGHLVSGTARFAGALSTIVKLAVGVALAVSVARLAGLEPMVRASRPQPDWVEWGALVVSAFAFAVLFRARVRDVPLVMAAAMAGYVVSRVVGDAYGSPAGVFSAALLVTAAGNAFARWVHRPGALVRVPGIILMVPGSTSLRGLLDVIQQQTVDAGQAAWMAVLNILMALVAGVLFGNLLLPTRRNL